MLVERSRQTMTKIEFTDRELAIIKLALISLVNDLSELQKNNGLIPTVDGEIIRLGEIMDLSMDKLRDIIPKLDLLEMTK